MSTAPQIIGFVCSCEERARQFCSGEGYYGEHDSKPYCVFHCPDPDKKEAFDRAIKAKLANKDYTFQGFWFPRYSFANLTFEGDVDFRFAHFDDGADFGESKFGGVANFDEAEFGGFAKFDQAQFIASAYFNDAKFEYAYFSNSRFETDAWFNTAEVYQDTFFEGARFADQAYFRATQFATRRGINKNQTYFNNVQFRSTVDFISAHFHNEVAFAGTSFDDRCFFWGTDFDADADFSRTRFKGPAGFHNCKFVALADFAESQFQNEATFAKVHFRKRVSFASANFVASPNFHKTDFEYDEQAEARDDDESSRKPAEGSTSEPSLPTVDFRRTRFKDGARFDGNKFTQGSFVSFAAAIFDMPARTVFHTMELYPHWFIDIDTRGFSFIGISWTNLDTANATRREMMALESGGRSNLIPLLDIALRQLAVNAEDNNRYEEAANFRYMAMDMKRLLRKRRIDPLRLSWWYWLLSGYGEKVERAFIGILLILVLFAVGYWSGTAAWWQPKQSSTMVSRAGDRQSSAGTGNPLSFTESLIYSFSVMALQKPEPLPANRRAKTLVLLETVLGPLQAALLALAIRRKFMR